MTDKFDPATHRFGMAYIQQNDGTSLFPFTSNGEIAWVVRPKSKGLHRDIPVQSLTRAPEHDLVPVSELQSERDLADSLAVFLKQAVGTFDNDTLMNYTSHGRFDVSSAREALAAHAAKRKAGV